MGLGDRKEKKAGANVALCFVSTTLLFCRGKKTLIGDVAAGDDEWIVVGLAVPSEAVTFKGAGDDGKGGITGDLVKREDDGDGLLGGLSAIKGADRVGGGDATDFVGLDVVSPKVWNPPVGAPVVAFEGLVGSVGCIGPVVVLNA